MKTPIFDIFRMDDANGSLRWADCAETMNEAMEKIKARMALDNLSYVISNWMTEERTVVSPQTLSEQLGSPRVVQ
jgi:hypothetical protein